MRTAAIIVVALAASGCGPKAAPHKPEPSSVTTGECADPTRDGVLGKSPRLRRADRDLDGDGREEAVVADGAMCSSTGNCHWNLFSEKRGCWRFLGTVAGAGIQVENTVGEGGFVDLVAWWAFGGGRSLRQEFRFRRGGYELAHTLICREADDDRVLCASGGRLDQR